MCQKIINVSNSEMEYAVIFYAFSCFWMVNEYIQEAS
jgi:hypothetical protein